MTLYDMDSPSGMQQQAQDEVFNTCVSKMETMLGATDDKSTLTLQQLRPAILTTCTNVTSLAKVLYDTARPFHLDRLAPPSVAVPLYGVLSPVIIVFSFFLNGGLVFLLSHQRNRITATGVLLGGMAVMDGLTGLLQLPFLFSAYVLDKHEDYLSMAWCKEYWYVSKLLPTITHTASLWLAAMLALQRHLGVRQNGTEGGLCVCCKHCMTKVLCTFRGAIGVVVVCVLSSGLLHVLQVTFLCLRSVKLLSKHVFTSRGLDMIQTCSPRLRDPTLEVAYYYVYTWLRLILAEFVPCFVIGGLNVSLVRTTRRSSRYRQSLVHGHRESVKQETRSARRTTVMLMTVTTTALVTEVVVVVILLVEFVHVATGRSFIQESVVNHLGVVSNFLITVTLPANFLIYSYMGGHIASLLKVIGCQRLSTILHRRRSGTGQSNHRDYEENVGGRRNAECGNVTEDRDGEESMRRNEMKNDNLREDTKGDGSFREDSKEDGKFGNERERDGHLRDDEEIDGSLKGDRETGVSARETRERDTSMRRDKTRDRSLRENREKSERLGNGRETECNMRRDGERTESPTGDRERDFDSLGRDRERRPSVFVVDYFVMSDVQVPRSSVNYDGDGDIVFSRSIDDNISITI